MFYLVVSKEIKQKSLPCAFHYVSAAAAFRFKAVSFNCHGGRGSQCAENCSTLRENFNLISRQRNELMLRVSGAIISKKPWTGASERASYVQIYSFFRDALECQAEKKRIFQVVLRKAFLKLFSNSIFYRSKVNIGAADLFGEQSVAPIQEC